MKNLLTKKETSYLVTLTFIITFMLIGCDYMVRHADDVDVPFEPISYNYGHPTISKKVEGESNIEKDIGLNFIELISINQLQEVLNQFNVQVFSIKYYTPEVSGGFSSKKEPQSVNDAINQLKDGLLTNSNLEVKTETMAEKTQNHVRMFSGFNYSEKKSLQIVSEGNVDAVWGIIIRGKISDIRQIADILKFYEVYEFTKDDKYDIAYPKPLLDKISTDTDINLSSEEQVNIIAEKSSALLATSYKPNRGSIYYNSPNAFYKDGRWKNDVFGLVFFWDEPGNFGSENAGIEMDVNIKSSSIYSSCVSSTTLPIPYDDCPTARYAEIYPSFGFGTFSAKEIKKGQRYTGAIAVFPDWNTKKNVKFDWAVVAQKNEPVNWSNKSLNSCAVLLQPICAWNSNYKTDVWCRCSTNSEQVKNSIPVKGKEYLTGRFETYKSKGIQYSWSEL